MQRNTDENTLAPETPETPETDLNSFSNELEVVEVPVEGKTTVVMSKSDFQYFKQGAFPGFCNLVEMFGTPKTIGDRNRALRLLPKQVLLVLPQNDKKQYIFPEGVNPLQWVKEFILNELCFMTGIVCGVRERAEVLTFTFSNGFVVNKEDIGAIFAETDFRKEFYVNHVNQNQPTSEEVLADERKARTILRLGCEAIEAEFTALTGISAVKARTT